ncbi:uncharacterized protein LOC142767379 isoform X1 [Rhipicephalus microplus]|uniref:uncharacterized protein LOC142767379 isoform X1 n=1 Tax=Rhipicephalus microplus TaxID=6941 RepID=UPI003F6CF36F
MAVSTNYATVRLRMDEDVSVLVKQINALNPRVISELVLSDCVISEPGELCAQISRCERLRRLSCVGCVLQPGKLLKLMLEELRYLQRLELSLVQDLDWVIDSEINSMRTLALQRWDLIRYDSLRRLYVEIGGDRNFDLLWELLVFCPNLTELHIHFVRGCSANALEQCSRLHDQLEKLEVFTLTSERPAYVPSLYGPAQWSTFLNCAAVCGNVRHDKPHQWWSCVELGRIARSPDRPLVLPSQLVVFVSGDEVPGKSEWEASRRHNWTRVRELCLLLLPGRTTSVYPTALGGSRDYLEAMFLALDNLTELNVSSFHFHHGVDLRGIFQDTPVGSRLLALSVPPCWFPRQSSVRTLLLSCPKLKDLDVRFVTRGSLRCASCVRLANTLSLQEPSKVTTYSSTSNNVTRLTLHDVPYAVLLSYFRYCGAATTLRLALWRWESPQYDRLFVLLGKFTAVRCLLLEHGNLPIDDQHFLASLSRMTNLQHLCLLTCVKAWDTVASQCAHDFIARSTRLKCVHMHYNNRHNGLEQRLTWLNRGHGEILLREGSCFSCCSTATFIGLVKPVNRDCEADL